MRKLFIPYDGSPMRYITDQKEFDATRSKGSYCKGESIGPDMIIRCWRVDGEESNIYLWSYGLDYPGPCLITKYIPDDQFREGMTLENPKEYELDVDLDLHENLEVLVENELERRLSVMMKWKALFKELDKRGMSYTF